MDADATLDVYHLPPTAFDTRMPIWWGNTLFMVIETTTMLLLVASYFYLARNEGEWPPPRADAGTLTADRLPGLGVSTLNLLLLAASCVPMIRVDRAARRHDVKAVRAGLVLVGALGLASIALRLAEFPALKFRWDDNAYGSLIWAIVGMHLLYIAAATLEVFVVILYIWWHGMDEEQAVDVTLTAIYWYWMVGLWVPLYAIVYWAPRIL